jgi:hypothetical protein
MIQVGYLGRGCVAGETVEHAALSEHSLAQGRVTALLPRVHHAQFPAHGPPLGRKSGRRVLDKEVIMTSFEANQCSRTNKLPCRGLRQYE